MGEGIVDYWDYYILIILMIVSLWLVCFSANRQLKSPILAYGGLGLAIFIPITIPIYLGVMFFKAKKTRLFIYIFFLSFSLMLLNLLSSDLSKNIVLSDLYSGNITLEDEKYISIEGGFLKLHEDQYLVSDNFNLGGRKVIHNKFYYEIVPINRHDTQKVKIFVSGGKIFNGKPPSENLINYNRFNAYVTLITNVDKTVVKKITSLLAPEQKIFFIAESPKSNFESRQKFAKIGSSIFGFLSLIFATLVLMTLKVNRNKKP